MAIISFTNYKRGQSRGCMRAVMRYTMQDKKTLWGDRQLVTGVNCQPESVYADFMTTKRLYHKTEGVLFYHMVQSFPKGERVDPVAAHTAALKLAEYFEGCEVLVCTHTDRDHIHSHFIINSVNFDTGRKLHMDKEQLQELRRRNDRVCMELALPVFQPRGQRKKTKTMTTGEYHTAARGQSKKLQLMNIINDCMRHAKNKEEFIALMESEGCKVRWEDRRKNITYTTPSGWQCRDRMLFGDKYLKENMEYEFRIRESFIYGRAHGEERPAEETAPNPDRFLSGAAGRRGGTDAPAGGEGRARRGDPVSHAGGAAQDRVSDRALGERQFSADGIPETAERDVRTADHRGTAGGTAETDSASGANGATGWETEREIFFSEKTQTASPETAASGWTDVGSPADDIGHVASALVGLGRRLEQTQYADPVMDSTTVRRHADSKLRRKEREKKIALGHAENDHEDEQTWQQTM